MEGWHEAACSAASLRDGPDPASSRDTEFSLPIDFAASTALIDEALIEPPSCSAKTKVLSYCKEKNTERKITENSLCIKLLIYANEKRNIVSSNKLDMSGNLEL